MKRKIEENWKHIEQAEKMIAEKTGDPLAGFSPTTFCFGDSGKPLQIPIKYRTPKGENFSKSYKEIMITANFCPFSGLPLYEDSVRSENNLTK